MTDPTSTTAKAKRSKGNIKPSTQDPIQRWLDIFIPMTGLPKARQADIRAELEDHLRARTGDLMITGLSEPEAVQQAVNELGETAHLAKQFRTALKPKRISPMHTALIAIAGSALTLGVFSTINNPAALPAQATTAAALAASENAEADTLANAVPATDYAFAKGGTIDLRTATLTTIFDQVRTNLDRPLVIHWEHLDQIGISKDQPIGLDADPLPTEVALRLAIQRAETEDFGGIAIVNNPDAVEITTTEYLDHRTKQIKPHDIADLIAHYEIPTRSQSPFPNTPLERNRETAEQAGNEILQTIMPLASRDDWTDFGGDLATASVVGSSLIINAPARIHAEVEQVIDMMQEQIDAFVNARAEADRLEAEAREQTIAELATQMERLEKEILDLTMQRNRLAGQSQLIEEQRSILRPQWVKYNPVNQRESADADKFAEVEAELAKLQNEKYMLQFEEGHLKSQIEDKSAYRQSLRERLIDLRYAPAEIEAAGNLRRFEETMRRQEARNGARQGKN